MEAIVPASQGQRFPNNPHLESPGPQISGAFQFQDTHDLMATAKKTTTQVPAKKAAPTTKAAKTAKTAAPAKKPVMAATVKPIKSAFNKTSLISHLAETAAVEIKAVKAIIASLEATILASVHKKGLGSFTLPGLLKVNVINVPAKKKRTGIDPFTKQERVFAAKPATVKIKTRALKKLKDAAL
jgi:hypothetical protein